ncbi:DNA-directed RNA polymerase subunit delta [Cohnella kolymensis]|uniref:Probable DNA-directed RNA polymerase subunit delta n=1 Tax=Cohnella kolymensis TaxID=1590652 RepID=A0ABR5A2D4_9BACL|nr:DNA-directed RNA polymerase subunit delta [Cohnella kolymensis]KIL34572.1 DNA-directed RNA polymerase subunit delta [Cohnella kolymensis]
MSAEYVLKLDSEKIQEMPMVDLAFELLKAVNTPFYYRDLMTEIAKIRGLSADQVLNVIAQLYTEINIDGRFACVGGNVWGLKRWYPVERSDDPMNGGAKRPRIINDDDDLDDEDLYGEDEEEPFTAGDEPFGLFDEEREEVFEEGEEAAETEEEALIEEDDETALEEELDGDKVEGDEEFEDDEDLDAAEEEDEK